MSKVAPDAENTSEVSTLHVVSRPTKTEHGHSAGEWVAPDPQIAEKHANDVHPRDNDRKLPLWKTTTKDLNYYGVGVGLFYRLLWQLSILLLVMSALALPALQYNWRSSGIVGGGIPVGRTTLGNLKSDESEVYFLFDDGMTKLSVERIGTLNGCMDLVYSVVFLVGLYLIFRDQRRVANEDNAVHAMPGDFSIWVWDLPADAKEVEVKDFFSKFGMVEEVSLAYNNSFILGLYLKRDALWDKLESLYAKAKKEERSSIGDKKIEEAEEKLRKLDARLDELQEANDNEKKVVCGFVMFSSQEERERAHSAYKRSWYNVIPLKSELKFRGHSLRVGRAPEPSDIQWDHLEVSSVSILVRRVIVWLLAIGLIGACFFAIYFANKASNEITPRDNACEYAKSPLNPTRAEVLTNGDSTFKCQVRYCTNLQQSLLPTDDALYSREACLTGNEAPCLCKFQYCDSGGVTSNPSFCSDYITTVAKAFSFQAGVILAVVIINSVLQIVLEYMTDFEMYNTISSETAGLAVKLTATMFLNTALITIIINGKIAAASGEEKVANNSLLFNGAYSDFESTWYRFVGTSIVISVVSSFAIHLLMIPVKMFGYYWLKRFLAKRALTQEYLNKAYEGPTYSLATNLAYSLNLLFVTLLYCGGMPILLPAAAFLFFLSYWMERIAFMRLYLCPPDQSIYVINIAMGMSFVGIIFHLMFSVWMYSSPYIFQNEVDDALAYVMNASWRLGRPGAIPVLILWLIVLASIVLIVIVRAIIKFAQSRTNADDGRENWIEKQVMKHKGTLSGIGGVANRVFGRSTTIINQSAWESVRGPLEDDDIVTTYDVRYHPDFKEAFKELDEYMLRASIRQKSRDGKIRLQDIASVHGQVYRRLPYPPNAPEDASNPTQIVLVDPHQSIEAGGSVIILSHNIPSIPDKTLTMDTMSNSASVALPDMEQPISRPHSLPDLSNAFEANPSPEVDQPLTTTETGAQILRIDLPPPDHEADQSKSSEEYPSLHVPTPPTSAGKK
mmetsp:Transcript_42702/g.69231  ORF Transcript_42702/g.69231 Transcript_42702/m.69231 type:complete len:1014 (+) Transcript_42702:110-3151(+)|eukprot:CAMPEP_0184658190 /NCGR_PEP_ID=MMETSP0308-20130426/24011_1 /TAXON_ID=38269 /ORGANISM="Gloeochaete witrockiana, Strain SAG 46.84" /LENGTH=1013 /DNA_ID=CAMNT_0027096923 /DNA_START=98 /DNA_END=3139 /DNA_ORIENTATION=+